MTSNSNTSQDKASPNIFFWQDRGCQIQHRSSPDKGWTTAKNPLLKLNPKWEYRVHPKSLQAFHVEGRKWWNGSYHEWSCGIFWAGQELYYSQCGSTDAGQRARVWLQDHGVSIPAVLTYSVANVRRKKDL